jgi:hypothetical protein
MKNHYEVLGVPENAAPAWIEREYKKRIDAVKSDSRLNSSAREKAIASLDESYAVLANAANREIFDAEFAAMREAKENSGMGAMLRRFGIPVVMIALAAGGGMFYMNQQEKKQLLILEQERERAAEIKRAEVRAAEAKRLEELTLLEAETRRKAEEERLQQAQAQRETEMKAEQYVAGKTFVPRVKTQAELREESNQRFTDWVEKRGRDIEARQAQNEEESRLAAARAEVARQQRFIDNSRREEDQAARRRANASKVAERNEEAQAAVGRAADAKADAERRERYR